MHAIINWRWSHRDTRCQVSLDALGSKQYANLLPVSRPWKVSQYFSFLPVHFDIKCKYLNSGKNGHIRHTLTLIRRVYIMQTYIISKQKVITSKREPLDS